MKARKRILLYGNSLVLGSIAAIMRQWPQVAAKVVLLPRQEPQELGAEEPDILLFDMETTHSGAVLPLLETNPTLQLIGISPGINLIKIWSIRELREPSLLDLFNLITNGAKDLPGASGARKIRD